MQNNQISQILYVCLAIAVVILFALIAVLIYVYFRNKEKKKDFIEGRKKSEKSDITETKTTEYNVQSIKKFMEFDEITDNMIVQKNGMKYLMVVQCQGVNYDLMSGMEKAAVEEGFIQFLNTLRTPVQLYVQTRTVNLEESINNYKERVEEYERNLKAKELEYAQNKASGLFTDEELRKSFFELTKLRNLCEYGKDIVYNTEKMSLNKNILNKQYYVIIPYYPEEISSGDFDKEEIKNIAFSELYTKAQSIIYSLASTGVTGKILTSVELAELLYVSYNRDDAEIYGIDKAIRAGYDALYSTAPDVIDKKIEELDKEITQKSIDRAETAILKAKTKREEKLEQRIQSKEEIIDEFAKSLLAENAPYIGEEMALDAINVIDEEASKTKEKKEGMENGKTNASRTKRRAIRKK